MRAILLLLYGGGLRISEALALNLDDVDLSAALIIVRDTKFHKTRLVPLGTELNQEMVRHAEQRSEGGHNQSSTAPFFVLRRGGRVQRPLVEWRFKLLREYAGIERVDGAINRGYMICATHSPFIDWCRGINKALTYRNYCRACRPTSDICASDTQPYLTMIPELLHEASARFERYAWKEENHD